MGLNIKREDQKQWLNEGLKKGATHCLIICDTWAAMLSPPKSKSRGGG